MLQVQHRAVAHLVLRQRQIVVGRVRQLGQALLAAEETTDHLARQHHLEAVAGPREVVVVAHPRRQSQAAQFGVALGIEREQRRVGRQVLDAGGLVAQRQPDVDVVAEVARQAEFGAEHVGGVAVRQPPDDAAAVDAPLVGVEVVVEHVRLGDAELELAEAAAGRQQHLQRLAAAVERLVVEDLADRGDRVEAARWAPQVEVALVEGDLRLRALAGADADAPAQLAGGAVLHVEPDVDVVGLAGDGLELQPRTAHRRRILEVARLLDRPQPAPDLDHVDAVAGQHADPPPDHLVAGEAVAADHHVAQHLRHALLDLEHQIDLVVLDEHLARRQHRAALRTRPHARVVGRWMAAATVEVLDRLHVALQPFVVVELTGADLQFALHLLGRVARRADQRLAIAQVLDADVADPVARPLDDDERQVHRGAIGSERDVGEIDGRVAEAAAAVEQAQLVEVLVEHFAAEGGAVDEPARRVAVDAGIAHDVGAAAEQTEDRVGRERRVAGERDPADGHLRSLVDHEPQPPLGPRGIAVGGQRGSVRQRPFLQGDGTERVALAPVARQQHLAHRVGLGAGDLAVDGQAQQAVDGAAIELAQTEELDGVVDLDLELDDEGDDDLAVELGGVTAGQHAPLVPQAADVGRHRTRLERLPGPGLQRAHERLGAVGIEQGRRRARLAGAGDLDRAHRLALHLPHGFLQHDLVALATAVDPDPRLGSDRNLGPERRAGDHLHGRGQQGGGQRPQTPGGHTAVTASARPCACSSQNACTRGRTATRPHRSDRCAVWR